MNKLNLENQVSEQELLEQFQIEELEQRLEMGWISSAEVSVTANGSGGSINGIIRF